MINLRRLKWRFDAAGGALSAVTRESPRSEFTPPAEAPDSFTVTFTVNLKRFRTEKPVLDIPGVLDVRLRQHDPGDRNLQNYPAFKMPDGSVPVLEAKVRLHSDEHPDWQNMTIGIPLAMLDKPYGKHDVALHFSGVHWTMYVDGELLDNDFPFGYPRWPRMTAWSIDADCVKAAAVHIPALQPRPRAVKGSADPSGIQYWLPPGHNSWVGDVATISYGGRYHVFYLYDRRHHNSKFGRGAHYFEHLSTEDFRTWTEHEAATPLEKQWECIGTGVPFVFEGRLCISYGLHTTRVYAKEKTMLPAQWAYLEKHGCTGIFKRGVTPERAAGSTYSVCTDGVSTFEKSNTIFHPCENPSVYTDPDGRLRMLANFGSNGIWESDAVDGGWRCINPGFPPGGDCTFFFRWGRFDYIIGGFTGLWSKPADAPIADYKDVVSQGIDFYDGSNVPSITEIAGHRFLMAAWIPIRGWGGNLVIRELVQFPDGRIGAKWMPEVMPEMEPPVLLAERVSGAMPLPADCKAFMLVFRVNAAAAGKGRLAVSFLSEEWVEGGCELQIRLDDRRAQFGPAPVGGFAGNEKSLREGGAPQGVGNYAVEHLVGTEAAFTVRVIVLGCDKIGGTLVDAEIAGRRTMLSYRPDLTVKKMVCRTEGVELMDVQCSALKNR